MSEKGGSWSKWMADRFLKGSRRVFAANLAIGLRHRVDEYVVNSWYTDTELETTYRYVEVIEIRNQTPWTQDLYHSFAAEVARKNTDTLTFRGEIYIIN